MELYMMKARIREVELLIVSRFMSV